AVRLCNYMDVYANDYITADLQFMDASASPGEIERYRVARGDVLLTKDSETPDDIGNSSVVLDDIPDLICGYHLALVRPDPRRIDPVFLAKQLGSAPTARRFARLASGSTRYGLAASAIASTTVPIPPLDEQRRVSAVLSSIDDTVKQTEALIAKYQQIKAGLMQDLFTRGVTPNGHLRPPRAESPHLYEESCIGWIPVGWGVSPIEALLARIIDYRGKTPEKSVAGVPLITARNIRMGYIDPEPREFIEEKTYASWMTRGIPGPSDVVFTTEAPLGNVAQVGTVDRVAFAQRVLILQTGPILQPDFLKFLLMTGDVQRRISRLATGTTALGIKQSEFRKIPVSYPLALPEQLRIVERARSLDERVEADGQSLDKLRQQKQGLMHDLLTGKVRVHLA
ncbi:MAG TPA: restriction endonuclease subunit S, partial [Nitrospira sp.]|nr:restriction endonuclease subunit S [Nitrospira sp.]